MLKKNNMVFEFAADPNIIQPVSGSLEENLPGPINLKVFCMCVERLW